VAKATPYACLADEIDALCVLIEVAGLHESVEVFGDEPRAVIEAWAIGVLRRAEALARGLPDEAAR
jgi:hypothetical protein